MSPFVEISGGNRSHTKHIHNVIMYHSDAVCTFNIFNQYIDVISVNSVGYFVENTTPPAPSIYKLEGLLSIYRKLVRRIRELFLIYELGGATVYLVYTSVHSVQFTLEYFANSWKRSILYKTVLSRFHFDDERLKLLHNYIHIYHAELSYLSDL